MVFRAREGLCLHAKQIHYPSGYPMPRSPPLFICSSPGPDPYRSHDNVYEELEHGPGRDTDSEPPIQSDDDFAEDELSLPGDRSFHKSPSDGGGTTVATIYHDRSNGGSSNSAATTASGSTVPVADVVAAQQGPACGGPPSGGSSSGNCNGNGVVVPSSGGLGMFRSRKHQPATLGGSGRRTNNCGAGGPLGGGDPMMLPPMYDDRGMMTLPPPAYNHHHHHPHHHHGHGHHLNSVNNNATPGGRANYYSTIDDTTTPADVMDPVERRNRINAQLSASSGPIGGVSTIFRNGGHRAPPILPATGGGVRSRTNPRSSDRRNGARNGNQQQQHQQQLAVISTPQQDPSQYIYHEPVFHEGLIYDGCLSHTYSDRSGGSGSTGTGSTGGVAYHPYILPAFTTFRNGGGAPVAGPVPPHHPAHSIYSRDSSFGSDSGYSQHTQTSNRSVAGWSQRRPTASSTGSGAGLPAALVAPAKATATNTTTTTAITEQQPPSSQAPPPPPPTSMVVDS
uniref:Uncharacterized protein n=1 Tax=Anopheles dirus TaxID=7168 RepID=A0A182NRI5_9DIPT